MGFKIHCIVLIAVLVLVAPTAAWAVHPFQVDETNTQGRGNILFELNDDFSDDDSNKTTELTGIFTVGALKDTDFTVEVPYKKLDPNPASDAFSSGIGDVQIRWKQRLFENEVKQSMGFQLYVNLPSGDVNKGLGTNNIVWGVKLMDQQVCHGNVLHANLGYEINGGDLKRFDFSNNYALLFGLSAELKLSEAFWFLTELYGESQKTVDEGANTKTYSRPWTFMAGFRYDIFKSWYVDLAGRAGLNKDAADYTVLAGTALRF